METTEWFDVFLRICGNIFNVFAILKSGESAENIFCNLSFAFLSFEKMKKYDEIDLFCCFSYISFLSCLSFFLFYFNLLFFFFFISLLSTWNGSHFKRFLVFFTFFHIKSLLAEFFRKKKKKEWPEKGKNVRNNIIQNTVSKPEKRRKY